MDKIEELIYNATSGVEQVDGTAGGGAACHCIIYHPLNFDVFSAPCLEAETNMPTSIIY
jgi:hypothetical protein